MREYEIYKGIYCSLCRTLGREYGLLARMTLSYDFAFFAILQIALKEECPRFIKGHCPFNPTTKCLYCQAETESLSMAAGAAVIMVYYKVLDNVKDSSFFKRLGWRMLLPFAAHARKKARRRYPEIDALLYRSITRQDELEQAECNSLDRAADPTAQALGTLCAMYAQDDAERAALERLGYCIGRYVYLMDAVDDMEKDAAHHNYNVFLLQFDSAEAACTYAHSVLHLTVSEAVRAYEQLKPKRFQGILTNILYDGLGNVIETITASPGGRCEDEKSL